MAAREPPRATNAGGPAARDECVGHERERGRSARPLAIASSAASDCRGGRVHWHTVPPLLLVARPWSAAPWRGRLVRALGQRPTRARPYAPLGGCGSDHAAEHHSARRRTIPLHATSPPPLHVAPPCGSRAVVSPAAPVPHPTHLRHSTLPPHRLLFVSPLDHATGSHPRPLHRQQQPRNLPLFGQLCRCAASRCSWRRVLECRKQLL